MNGNEVGYGNQHLLNQQAGLQGLGTYQYPPPVKAEAPPRTAADLLAIAAKRITEIDAELARVPELQAERERLQRIVEAK